MRRRAWASTVFGALATAAICIVAAQAETPITPAARQYAAAEQAFQAKDDTLAEQLYSKFIEADGDDPRAWFRIGLIEQRRGSFRAALNAYDRAIESAPSTGGPEIAQVLAKARFNRAVLLLESAAADLNRIAPGTLEEALDQSRQSMTTQLHAALQTAGAPTTAEPARPATTRRGAALGYVFEVQDATDQKSIKKEPH